MMCILLFFHALFFSLLYVTLSALGKKKISRQHFEIFFLTFSRIKALAFLANCLLM